MPRWVGQLIHMLAAGELQCLVQIGEDVVDVLDADAQADAAGGDARGQLFRRRHLPVGGRGRMAGEDFASPKFTRRLKSLSAS